MNEELNILLRWVLLVTVGTGVRIFWDVYSYNRGAIITSFRKIASSMFIVIVSVISAIYFVFWLDHPVLLVSALAIFIHTALYWIPFDLGINRGMKRSWDYISDDGITNKMNQTSWDDALFHKLADFIWGIKGREYSGKLKFGFKVFLLIVSFIMM